VFDIRSVRQWKGYKLYIAQEFYICCADLLGFVIPCGFGCQFVCSVGFEGCSLHLGSEMASKESECFAIVVLGAVNWVPHYLEGSSRTGNCGRNLGP